MRQRLAAGKVEGLVVVPTRSDGSQALAEDMRRVHGIGVVEAQRPREHSGLAMQTLVAVTPYRAADLLNSRVGRHL